METLQIYGLYALTGANLALCVWLLYKVRNVIYLLEQPVVKKLSPQLKLKPVKVDELDDESRRNQNRAPASNGAAPVNRPQGRPMERAEGQQDRQGGRDQGRDRMPRHEREPHGSDRGNGDRGGDRGPRNDRDRFRDRDRGGRHDRHERHGGGDRGPRREVFSNERDAAPAGAPVMGGEDLAQRPAAPAPEASASPTLSPRRPLPSTLDHAPDNRDLSAPVDNDAALVEAADPMFGRDDSDIQHGRRNQPKKKPRFELDVEEVKAPSEETKA